MPKKMKNIITSVFSHFAKAKSYNIKEYPAIKKSSNVTFAIILKFVV